MKKTTSVLTAALLTLSMNVSAAPDTEEFGTEAKQSKETKEARKSEKEARKEAHKREREMAKDRREYEREMRKGQEESEREGRKHRDEMQRENRKYEEEMARKERQHREERQAEMREDDRQRGRSADDSGSDTAEEMRGRRDERKTIMNDYKEDREPGKPKDLSEQSDGSAQGKKPWWRFWQQS